jgi:tetratricopeptide (TPR) repeat protein
MRQNDSAQLAQIAPLEAAAVRAAPSGRDAEAKALLRRILEIDPGHERTLAALGQHGFRTGDFQTARSAFQRLVDADGADAERWINLALACRQVTDEAPKRPRFSSIDPDPEAFGVILRADLLERQGKTHEAALANVAIVQVSPPLQNLRPELRPAVSKALANWEQYGREFGAFLDQRLDPYYQELAGENLKRFRDSIDIMVGRKRRYESRSEIYHYPGLAPIEFFDRADFPWLDSIEAATDAIRDEFVAILEAEDGFTPYISYPPGVPLNQWVELNNSPRWSAFHLYKMGKRIEENAAKCPKTMEALDGAPQPDSTRTHAGCDVFIAQTRDSDSAAYRRDQCPPGHAPSADRPRGLWIPSRQRHAAMGARTRMGVRRHHRARGVER